MAVAIGGAGFYFGSNPTSSDSKHADDTFGKRNWGRWEHKEKEAPSALHSVIIPNVNLPKV
ncbi:hypothetical protein EX30DRAFT_337030 [Ascodesmis nigricans]|uniref:Uncharacterized protein n=1 Tax=Ascodesmis nigricans TaxID=341454 RepID=A0A4S2N5Q5_9PEZI|nr:hypothetical protein EX30DRAFT_337030 [Ascodesmis nigricans]